MSNFVCQETLNILYRIILKAQKMLQKYIQGDKAPVNPIGLFPTESGNVRVTTWEDAIIEDWGDGCYVRRMYIMRLYIGKNINLPQTELDDIIQDIIDEIEHILHLYSVPEKDEEHIHNIIIEERSSGGYNTIGIHK